MTRPQQPFQKSMLGMASAPPVDKTRDRKESVSLRDCTFPLPFLLFFSCSSFHHHHRLLLLLLLLLLRYTYAGRCGTCRSGRRRSRCPRGRKTCRCIDSGQRRTQQAQRYQHYEEDRSAGQLVVRLLWLGCRRVRGLKNKAEEEEEEEEEEEKEKRRKMEQKRKNEGLIDK